MFSFLLFFPKNEENIDELGFNTLSICKDFFLEILPMFANYDSDRNRTSMQFVADIIASMNKKGLISINDLYLKTEEEVISLIENCEDNYIKDNFIKYKNALDIYAEDIPKDNIYCISVKSKKRYILPLVKTNCNISRINNIDKNCENKLTEFLSLKRHYYTGFEFDFKPYK